MLAQLDQKHMPKESPILIRLFKEESEIEVWKQDASGRFALLKTYPVCRWSGELGPKTREGDRQAPEGFYTVTPGQMNPNSHYYLSFDIGYPNAYDRAYGRTGSNIMVHGDCSSRGCYAMTDEQILEIYALARESFLGNQQSFQVQAYPFRMTPLNMAKHRDNPNMPFWKMLKEGNDHFEITHLEPKVNVCEGRYVFDAEPMSRSLVNGLPGNGQTWMNGSAAATPLGTLTFNPTGWCPVYEIPREIAAAVAEKNRRDENQTFELIGHGLRTVPIRTGRDGGMHPVFRTGAWASNSSDVD
jgi:murein L,D-transpeptidase YafK